MSAPRRRIQVPFSDLPSSIPNENTARPTPRRSASNGQNDTILYIFTIVILVIGLIIGYKHMPSPPGPGLNKAIFNPRLYSHIQSLWFAEVPAGATTAGEASVKKWFYNPNADERAAFDKTCTQAFRHALEEIGPKRLRLPPFVDFTVERQMARSLASPLMSEIDPSSDDLTTETAASNALSLILLLDQLSRNIYRADQALIYSHYDRLSQALIHHILATQPRLDLMPKYRHFPVYRTWFYMPLMHSEHIEDHALFHSLVTSLKEDVAKLGDEAAVKNLEQQLEFEKRHAKIIEQFGRYPYRNKVLGRETTEEEKKWLEEGGDHFGTS
jgi:uncharacterized protein (DUF924 family)